jgi:ABC-type phosphate transport system substrate-binding protein
LLARSRQLFAIIRGSVLNGNIIKTPSNRTTITKNKKLSAPIKYIEIRYAKNNPIKIKANGKNIEKEVTPSGVV